MPGLTASERLRAPLTGCTITHLHIRVMAIPIRLVHRLPGTPAVRLLLLPGAASKEQQLGAWHCCCVVERGAAYNKPMQRAAVTSVVSVCCACDWGCNGVVVWRGWGALQRSRLGRQVAAGTVAASDSRNNAGMQPMVRLWLPAASAMHARVPAAPTWWGQVPLHS
jgi:hypothetical protein